MLYGYFLWHVHSSSKKQPSDAGSRQSSAVCFHVNSYRQAAVRWKSQEHLEVLPLWFNPIVLSAGYTYRRAKRSISCKLKCDEGGGKNANTFILPFSECDWAYCSSQISLMVEKNFLLSGTCQPSQLRLCDSFYTSVLLKIVIGILKGLLHLYEKCKGFL